MKRVALAGSPSPARADGRTPGSRSFPLEAPRWTPPLPTLSADITELVAKAAIVTLLTLMAVRIGADVMATGRFTGLLLLGSEALVVVLTVLRRSPGEVDRSMRARLLTTVSMLGPPLVRPAAFVSVIPDAATVAVSAIGLAIVIGGKLSLGRSFGLIPANRGVVSSGLYRIVRHPIYLGYLICHGAFLAANPTVWNVAILATADITLLIRAVCEEQTLARDPQYSAYLQRTRWRVVPGLF